MADSEKRLWGIHTQDDNLFLKHGTIAIGWREMGDLNAIENNREAFKAKYQLVYPDAKKGSIPTGSGMLYRFCHEVQIVKERIEDGANEKAALRFPITALSFASISIFLG